MLTFFALQTHVWESEPLKYSGKRTDTQRCLWQQSVTVKRHNPAAAHQMPPFLFPSRHVCWHRKLCDLPSGKKKWLFPFVQTTNCVCTSACIERMFACTYKKRWETTRVNGFTVVTSGKWFWWKDGGCALLYKSKLLNFQLCIYFKKKTNKQKKQIKRKSYPMEKYVYIKLPILASINISIQ